MTFSVASLKDKASKTNLYTLQDYQTTYVARFQQFLDKWSRAPTACSVVRRGKMKTPCSLSWQVCQQTTGLPTGLHSRNLNYRDDLQLPLISIPKITQVELSRVTSLIVDVFNCESPTCSASISSAFGQKGNIFRTRCSAGEFFFFRLSKLYCHSEYLSRCLHRLLTLPRLD